MKQCAYSILVNVWYGQSTQHHYAITKVQKTIDNSCICAHVYISETVSNSLSQTQLGNCQLSYHYARSEYVAHISRSHHTASSEYRSHLQIICNVVEQNVQITFIDYITVVDQIICSHHSAGSKYINYISRSCCWRSEYVDHINIIYQDVQITLVEHITVVDQNMQSTLVDHTTVLDQNMYVTSLQYFKIRRSYQ